MVYRLTSGGRRLYDVSMMPAKIIACLAATCLVVGAGLRRRAELPRIQNHCRGVRRER
jgi:hypothetical protein